MEAELWRKVEELYHAAMAQPAEMRAEFLEGACSDAQLRAGVQSLIDQADTSFLERSPLPSTIRPGMKLGNFELVERIGRGGMGEVWRARDPRLKRDVAIKLLPGIFARDPERIARFEHEARAASALNHPNIVSVFDIGHENEAWWIVSELVEGEPLSELIRRGPLPVRRVVEIGTQIAGGLAAAHAAGIVHRDLKPGNVMVRRDGGVKIVDFGLAKRERSTQESGTLTDSGAIVGTAGYMSPEQVRGETVDARSDIFSFGVILYEMLSGRKAFTGTSSFEMMNAILKDEPVELTGLPPAFDRIVRHCLEKPRERRFQSAADIAFDLNSLSLAAPTQRNEPHRRLRSSRWLPWIAVAVLAVVALYGWMRTIRPEDVALSGVSFAIVPPSGKELEPVGSLSVDRISPDGSMLYFRISGRYYVRRLNSLESEALTQFRWFGDPFWAPDSRSIAFPTDHSRMMKMRVPKGAPELVAYMGDERGGSWGEKGIILFAEKDVGLFRASAAGGKALRVEVPDLREGGYYSPEFLPGGEDFLFEFVPADSEGAQVYIATLSGEKAVNSRFLLGNETAAAFTPVGGGRILFVRNDNLYSQRLDLKARKLSGDPELLQERVASFAGPRVAYFSVSRNGTLVWRSGTAVVSQVTVFDRKGKRTGVAGTPLPVNVIRLSPDESRLIASGEAGAWIVEAYGAGRTRLAGLYRETEPLWSADGSRLIFAKGKKLFERLMSGSGDPRVVAEIPLESGLPLNGVSPDGRRILFGEPTGVSFFPLDGKGAVERVVGQRADDLDLSPDGMWVVYRRNDELGLYAQPVSGAGLARQIADTGSRPVWRADGKEILYVQIGPSKLSILSVRVEGSGDALRFAAPVPLFSAEAPMGGDSASRPLAVSRDGSRIYFLQSAEQPDSGVINVRIRAIR